MKKLMFAIALVGTIANAAPCQLTSNKLTGDALKCEEVARKAVKDANGSKSATCENGTPQSNTSTEYTFKSTPGGYWLVDCAYTDDTGCDCNTPRN